MKKLNFTLFLFVFASISKLLASLVVYPQPDLNGVKLTGSPKYSVEIRESGGQWVNSFVYYSQGHQPDIQSSPMTDRSNSHTNFSFSGTVEVKVKMLTGTASSCIVLPKSDAVTTTMLPAENAVIFTISKEGQYSVEFNNQHLHAMLLFANPMEVNPPTKATAKVHYFGPGVHIIGLLYGDNLRTDPANRAINQGDTIYMAGGSYLVGTISATKNNVSWPKTKNITVMGRGVLSCAEYPKKDNPMFHPENAFTYGIIRAGSYLKVDGITIHETQAYAVTCEDNAIFNNIKVMAWCWNTDAYTPYGINGTIQNSFSKVMDDHSKGDMPQTTINNCVFFMQDNGAAFLMTYNTASNTQGWGAKMLDCDIIHADQSYNAAVFGCQQGGGATLSNFTFENIRIEGNCKRLIGMAVRNNAWAYDQTKLYGRITNLTFKNIQLEGKSIEPAYLWGRTATDYISNVVFENLMVNGKEVETPNDMNLAIGPYVNLVYFKKNGVTINSYPGLVLDTKILKTITPSVDCPVHKSSPDEKFGPWRSDAINQYWMSEAINVYKNGTDEREGFIRFEQIPDTSQFSKAELVFFGNKNWGQNGIIKYTLLMDDSWSEATTTWNTSRNIMSSSIDIKKQFNLGLNIVDVTSFLKEKNNGKLSIKLSAENIGFFSEMTTKESLTPYLLLTKKTVTGIEHSSENTISVYPNPVNDILFLNGQNQRTLNAEIYDISGVKVINAMVSDRIDVSKLNKGIYFVRLTDKNKLVHTSRVIKN